jgi:ATP-dependent Clp protease ATP-binding subunit ClpA
MLNKDLENSLNIAFREASSHHHESLTIEHLLLTLLDNIDAINALIACDANIEQLRERLTEYIANNVAIAAKESQEETRPTLSFHRVLQRAVFHAQAAGLAEINGSHILAAIFSEADCQAVSLLLEANVSRADISNYLNNQTENDLSNPLPGFNDIPSSFNEELDDSELSGNPIEQYAINLNKQAKMGFIDPLIGREQEIERVIQILCRRRKNHPLLVGEAGVGKTAIAEGLAYLIVNKNVPEKLKNLKIYSLDLGALIAGTKYRGDFEKRFKALLQSLSNDPNSVLYIDEIHTIIGAGAASGGSMDASNLIKPLLSSGKLRCMGSTTYQEYRGVFEKERALARRFQKLDIQEPNIEETVAILTGLQSRLESYHDIKYSQEALLAAAQLSKKYITDRFLPDKAIDVVDEAGAFQQLHKNSTRKKNIEVADIETIVAKMARIPEKQVSQDDRKLLKNLDQKLKAKIFGQDEAIDSLASAILMSRSGLKAGEKPIGSFLFAGPTGVGKTEVARQLAEIMGIELIRFDMSEYMEKHAVSKLIGTPPGYVGFEQGGLLTDMIHKKPHAVLLLDEVEKAHPEIFNILLQVMDHGRLTDHNGIETDCRHLVLIMTTNAGAFDLTRSSIGFKNQEADATDSMQALSKIFSPEFRNRLDGIVRFQHLDEAVVQLVVKKVLLELEQRLYEKNVSIEISNDARSWLAEHGYDRAMGARPLERLVQERISKILAHEILFGSLANGGHVRISVNQDNKELAFEYCQSSDIMMASQEC